MPPSMNVVRQKQQQQQGDLFQGLVTRGTGGGSPGTSTRGDGVKETLGGAPDLL